MPKSEATIDHQTIALSGLRLRFTKRNGQLRIQSIVPGSVKAGPDAEGGPCWESVPALVHVAGRGRMGHYGARSIHTQPTMDLQCKALQRSGSAQGGTILARLVDPKTKLTLELRYRAVGAKGALRVELKAVNKGDEPITLEQLMICLPGLTRRDNDRWPETTEVHIARNCWFAEAQWSSFTPSQLGIADTAQPFGDPLGAGQFGQVGSWSTANELPMGVLTDHHAGVSYAWQLEHSSTWRMEVGRVGGAFYVAAGGPSAWWGDWQMTLEPGQSFDAPPLAVAAAEGGFADAIAALQGYRRKACRPACRADQSQPVIFNDYMNCLQADPTEAKELPLIDAAAQIGAEYYVIDAGWFGGKGNDWNHGLGDWIESPNRFDRGLAWLCDHIRQKKMTPGLWLEIEVASGNSRVFDDHGDDWFIVRDGARVQSGGRYFLNFANPDVRAYAHGVVDRLVGDYGIGYIKNDYNADFGLGDNRRTPSAGEGAMRALRGFYQWLDEVRANHPDLLIENCGSGGMRFDYGLLSRCHVQSTSDQTDYRRYPSIMAGSLAAGLPEQMCCWSYPLADQDDEAVCMNLVTPMLCRWHLSGRIDLLTPGRLALVREAVAVYKSRIRRRIPSMTPFWPLPMRHVHQRGEYLAAGLQDRAGKRAFVSVYRMGANEPSITLPLANLQLGGAEAELLFPTSLDGEVKLDRRAKTLTVSIPHRFAARLIEIRPKG